MTVGLPTTGKVVYHAVPPSMTGTVLFPLNQLRLTQPELYDRQVAKYSGREQVLQFRIPGLGIRWNDALHCAPIHPYWVAKARAEAGVVTSNFATECFRIPLERFRQHPAAFFENATFWINGRPGEDMPDEPPPEEFSAFDESRYRELDDVPAAYPAFLAEMASLGRRPLTFPTIPHVLVAGPIDITGLEVVTAEVEPDR
ncbi:hypothetical protein acdb102_48120 [Acidothermaceae bacterium B102]|nr:hypothetical protein acdb102_48120 [Acidothermaceae bacterium B102]